MSKSRGNAVSPIAVIDEHGVDISRLAMFFTAPSEKEVMWSNTAVVGVEKFVYNRLFPVIQFYRGTRPDLKRHFKKHDLTDREWGINIKLNQTIKRISDCIKRLQFNTAISALMELLRDYQPDEIKTDKLNDTVILKVIQLTAPLTPHLAEELWELAGCEGSVFASSWPECDLEAIEADMVEIAVQVNGRLRDTVSVPTGCDQAAIEEAAFKSSKVRAFIEGKEIVKKIYVPGRIFNIVVRG
jgi:leucyl-tRNA synthetase